MQIESIDTLLSESISKGIDYKDYNNQVQLMALEDRTSGNEQSEALINYTKLNARRMKHWDKTLKIADDISEKIAQLKLDMTWLVITETWCGDAAHVIPVLNKMAVLNEGIDMRMVYRDENPELMDAFLTNGNRAIAKVIMIDNTSKEVVSTYGPRPSAATRMVQDYKFLHGKLSPEFKEDLQRWYNKDKGATTVLDVVKLLEK